MGGVVRLCALLLAAASAAAAALIVAPAPSMAFALGAIAASEKSAWIALAAALALLLAVGDLLWGHRAGLISTLAALLAAGARALRAPLDTAGPGRPNLTVPYTTGPDGQTLSLDVYLPPAAPTTPARPS